MLMLLQDGVICERHLGKPKKARYIARLDCIEHTSNK